VKEELGARGEVVPPLVAMRVDQTASEPTVQVDCGSRMHICHAVCCKLNFALSRDEVESGDLKWDLGKPYFIRHDEDGYCHHNDRATGGCGNGTSINVRRHAVGPLDGERPAVET
jgi:hypothetical protein